MNRTNESQGKTWMMISLAIGLIGLSWWGMARRRAAI